MAAGTPRELGREIAFADWSPDGKELLVVRLAEPSNRLEWPVGKVLYSSGGYIFSPRVSPSGDRAAFIEVADTASSTASVVVVDRLGRRTVLADQFPPPLPSGLGWSPKGDEVWFPVPRGNSNAQELRAVALDGRQRLLYRDLVSTRLLDVAKDGKVLVAVDRNSGRNFFRGGGDVSERELSWLDNSVATGLSRDGRTVLISEQGDSVGSEGWADLYLRDTSGKAPLKLGAGYGWGFSADARVIAALGFSPPGIVLYPIASGSPETIPVTSIAVSDPRGLLPPAYQAVVCTGTEPSRGPRVWLVKRDGTQPHPITPEGVVAASPLAIPPDGTFVLGVSGGYTGGITGARTLAYPVAGGEPRPLKGLRDGEEVAGWGADGHSFFAYDWTMPLKIFHVDDRTGARTLVHEITPAERAGLRRIWALVTPDGKAYSYSTLQFLSELYLIEGLK